MRGTPPCNQIDESDGISDTVRLVPYKNSGGSFDPRWPKEEAVCDLNLAKWVELVERYDIGEDSYEVIDGCEKGFHQGIPDHTLGSRKWYTPPNHESAVQAAEKIVNTIAKERRANRIFGPFTHEEVFGKIGFFRSSPMGSVINGDGSFRIINDLSFPHEDDETPSVNSFVDKKKFETSWDDFKVIANFFQTHSGRYLVAIFDWEKAYRQIPIHPSQWRFLLLMDLNNRLWLDTRIQFGGVAGCGVFGRPADLWRKIIEKHFRLAAAFRWVDDNLLVKDESNSTSIQDVVNLSNEMGVASNVEKVYEFADEQRYIGFIWNVAERTVRLPEEKFKERSAQVDDFLGHNASFNLREVEKFVGRLVHTTYIVPNLTCYMTSLHRWKAEWKVASAKRKIPSDVREDLLEWQATLKVFKSRRFIPDDVPIDVNWVGDASMTGIGVLVGSRWAEFRLVKGWNLITTSHGKRNIAWAETVAIRLGLLVLNQISDVGGKSFIVLTDNTTSQSAVEKRKSRDRAVNEEWKAVQKLLVELHCDIVAERVETGDNMADLLSRGKDQRTFVDRVVIEVPHDLRLVVKQIL